MYVKNIYSHVSFVFMGNTTRLHTASDSDNTVSDSISDNDTNDSSDSEQNENISSSDSQEERAEEKELENTKEENIPEATEAEETQNTDNSEMNTEEATEAEETQSADNLEEINTEKNSEVEETQAIDNSEESTELTVTTLSDSDADIVTLLQENNELLQKQYTVTASYLNLLTFTLLAIWVINSIHKSVVRMSRRKEK